MEAGRFEEALTRLKARVGRCRKRARLLRRAYHAAVGLWLLAYGICFTLEKSVGRYPAALITVATVLAALVILAHIHAQVMLYREEVAAAAELANRGDLRTVGLLAEEMRLTDPEARPLAAKALARLLPSLRTADAELLTAHQRACLSRALRQAADTTSDCFDVPLAVAILEAFARIGDVRAVRLVRHLAEGPGAREERIRQAARICLPALLERLDHEREAQTLLRPAEAAPDTLLRPANSPSDAAPQDHLLRSPHE